jgi:sporulation protein YlmC with PRC-barrel domain
MSKSFLLLFFKKEELPFANSGGAGCQIRATREIYQEMSSHGALHGMKSSTTVLPLLLCVVSLSLPGVAAVPETTPAKVQQIRKARAEGLLGQPVTDGKGDTVGHIVDVLIDENGEPSAAVVEFAGFFGLGNRQVAVDWKALAFAIVQDRIVIRLGLDADQIKAMPEYTPSANSVPVATPSGATADKPH